MQVRKPEQHQVNPESYPLPQPSPQTCCAGRILEPTGRDEKRWKAVGRTLPAPRAEEGRTFDVQDLNFLSFRTALDGGRKDLVVWAPVLFGLCLAWEKKMWFGVLFCRGSSGGTLNRAAALFGKLLGRKNLQDLESFRV